MVPISLNLFESTEGLHKLPTYCAKCVAPALSNMHNLLSFGRKLLWGVLCWDDVFFVLCFRAFAGFQFVFFVCFLRGSCLLFVFCGLIFRVFLFISRNLISPKSRCFGFAFVFSRLFRGRFLISRPFARF